MISVMIEFAVFFLVLFFLLPSVLIFLMIMREIILHARTLARWRQATMSPILRKYVTASGGSTGGSTPTA